MKHLKLLSLKEKQLIYGGTTLSEKYIGNGVNSTKNKCTFDWPKPTLCIAEMPMVGFLVGAFPGKCKIE
ncbi:enterocin, partial [Enterococcus faecium]|nr:enterocin [Enterococcus faecium]